MARYLDPKNDLTFKRIFGEHPDLLVNFLNAVMPFVPGRFIEELTYLPSDLTPENPTKKYSIVDVRCRDNFKRQFIIEMQMYWDEAFYSRMVFNSGKAYIRQLGRGMNYNLLQPVYTLALLNENFDRKTDRYYHHFQIVNSENTDEIIPGLEFVLVELTDKFRPETVNDRRLMVLWLRFLKETGENMKSLPEEMQENEYICRAAELCEEGNFTPEELAAYEKYWDIISTEKTLWESAQRKGEAIGEAKARTEEKAIAKQEKVAVIEEIALKMIKKGTPVEDVCELTGLSREQVEVFLNN